MSIKPKLGGSMVALVTPMNDGGAVLYEDLHRLIEFQLASGTKGLVPTGTTGESPTLEWPIHHSVIKAVVKIAKDKAFILAGTGSNYTDEAIRYSCQAIGDGADGVLVVECYYNKPSSYQLRVYYHQRVAQEILKDNPQAAYVPYIIPGRTGCQMVPVDLAILAQDCPNVVGVKEATGDFTNMQNTRLLLGSDLMILSGDDNKTATMMADRAIAANGVISVMANIAPQAVSRMVEAFQNGAEEKAWKINTALEPLFGLVSIETTTNRKFRGKNYPVTDKFPNPCAVKTMMAGLGMISSSALHQPLGLMNKQAMEMCRQALLKVWNKDPWVLEPVEKFFSVDVGDRLVNKARWTNGCLPTD